jgi:creatinine amidohydrolase/Fe(II)-dependent formamide hydrolase-like protein
MNGAAMNGAAMNGAATNRVGVSGVAVSNKLAEMTTDQARDAVRLAPLVIIPVGAQEQHGGGMAMSTDTVRAVGLADLVAERLDGRAVIAPPVNYGVSPHHMAFAGTVTLSPATFQSVLRDLIASLHQHGWGQFLVITGHGGNNAALSVLAQEYLQQPGLTFAWTPITPLVSDLIAGMEVSQVHGHAGEAETAQMLYLHKRGVLGDPRRATAEDGRLLVETAADRIAAFADELLSA